MELKFKLAENDIITAQKLHSLGSKTTRIILIVTAIALILLALFSSYKLYPLSIVISGTIGYLVSYFIVIPYSAKKQFKEHKSLQSEISIHIEEESIKIQTITGNSKLDWDYLKKWKFNNKTLLIYITSRMFYILPVRVFKDDSELDEALKIIGDNLKKAT